MKLLNKSLKSSNLPAYLVAAFIKRLGHLALHAPSPSALFCVSQLTWLLKEHPQCHSLLHASSGEHVAISSSVEFNMKEEEDLARAGGLDSSLWELLALKHHHLRGVSTLATALEAPTSTTSGAGSSVMVVDDFIDHTYSDLVEAELKRIKKCAALAYKVPQKFIEEGDPIFSCFGSSM